MKPRRKSTGLIAFAVFVVFVIVSGFALKAADYIDSPFDDIVFTSHWVYGGEQQLSETFGQSGETLPLATPTSSADTGVDLTSLSGTSGQFQLPPVSALTDSSATADTSFSVGPDRQNGIIWSDVGEVFYDLWFISAVTAVFIIVQYIFKFSIKQIKSYLPERAVAK